VTPEALRYRRLALTQHDEPAITCRGLDAHCGRYRERHCGRGQAKR